LGGVIAAVSRSKKMIGSLRVFPRDSKIAVINIRYLPPVANFEIQHRIILSPVHGVNRRAIKRRAAKVFLSSSVFHLQSSANHRK
jgi:hypothetical protein